MCLLKVFSTVKFNKIILLVLFLFSLHPNHSKAQSYKDSGLLMPIRTFYYPNNIWELPKENLEYLTTSFIQDLRTIEDSNYLVTIEGHTDDTGNSRYNMELSQKRVHHILEILVQKGIVPERIKLTYFGESKPEKRNIAISKKKSDIRYANRRVVIKVQKQSKKTL
jgi:outer membrane protein OmpA-like peptidoglycan-associated protein